MRLHLWHKMKAVYALNEAARKFWDGLCMPMKTTVVKYEKVEVEQLQHVCWKLEIKIASGSKIVS